MSEVSSSCDVFEQTWSALTTEDSTPTKTCAIVLCAVVALTFIVSTLTGNYSQVDKLWSIVPFVYCWIAVCDDRTLLMALVATIWGCRLTWNFNRRGGYKWPPWDGDEDYRWKVIQDGHFLKILQNKIAVRCKFPPRSISVFEFSCQISNLPIFTLNSSQWTIFNFGFISLYQNILLLLIATPSIVANIAVTSCGQESPLNIYDLVATILVLFFVGIESVADNQQYAFQTEKYRRKDAGETLTGEYASGFKTSGLFSLVRKPNYAAEQAIWISFYLYSVAAFRGEYLINWSIIGCLLLCTLFQSSGWFTEKITLNKYPTKYAQYMNEVPLYLPNPAHLLTNRKSKKQE
jgi:steroid 5-alpha reductase family enzyme